jgi:DNA-binding PadR family transcriptional regulator
MFGHGRGSGGRGHHRGGWLEGIGGKAAHRRERLFEQGDLKLVVLSLLQERPRHGYEIIKAIEELAGGDYSPSPGVIYPTLTLLEEIGQATITQESGGKKQYGISSAGKTFLKGQREALDRTLKRIDAAGSVADAWRTPQLQRSIQNFKTALHFRLSSGPLTAEELHTIADAIDRAAVEIERN